jgi:PPM family protein phosphatase
VTTIFQRLIGRQKPGSDESEATASFPSYDPSPAPEQAKSIKALDWTFGAAQSVGRQREHNEDALFTFGSHLSYEERQAFLGLFIVADGMGGHENGELASGLAIQTMAQQIIGSVYSSFLLNQASPEIAALKNLMLESIQEANLAVKKHVPGGGTTLTALLIYKDQLYLTHVGDSRAYHISQDSAHKVLTRDHTLVRQLVELGQISSEEAEVHPQRNILSMALGQWEPLEPDFSCLPIPAQGELLICSDGLWGVVSEKKIAQLIQATNNPQSACLSLIEAANQAGGPDNITAILIHIPD